VVDVGEEVEHLGVGAAGLADGHLLCSGRAGPPVARAVEDDARLAGAHLCRALVRAHVDLLRRGARRREEARPDRRRLLVLRYAVCRVAAEARDVEAGRVQPDLLGEEGPELRDLDVLEVVTEAPAAEHLEERRVPVVAHLLDVLDAQTGLAVGEAVACRVVGPEEEGEQGLHAAAGEEGGRVVLRGEPGPGDDGVAALGEEAEEGPADLVGVHAPIPHPGPTAVEAFAVRHTTDAMRVAVAVASSPTPKRSEDRRRRRKWTPTKCSPGETVLSPSSCTGNPCASTRPGTSIHSV
jgi:hypothetical protein